MIKKKKENKSHGIHGSETGKYGLNHLTNHMNNIAKEICKKICHVREARRGYASWHTSESDGLVFVCLPFGSCEVSDYNKHKYVDYTM